MCLLPGRWRGASKSDRNLSSEHFHRRLDAALLWRWIIQWTPLLGQYSQRLQPEVRTRLHPEEVGGTLGFSAALVSSTRVIGPSAGGALLQTLGTWAPGVFGALITAWLATFVYRRLIVDPDSPLPVRSLESAPVSV